MAQKSYEILIGISDEVRDTYAQGICFQTAEENTEVVDYSKIPDLLAVALLTVAFTAVARKCQAKGAGMWLSGWILIAVHFLALMFVRVPGAIGLWAQFLGLSTLAWAASLFVRATLPYHGESSSRWMSAAFITGNGIYVAALCFLPADSFWLLPAALLFGLLPIAAAVVSIPDFQHPLRWSILGINTLLTIYLIAAQHRAGNGANLALSGLLFASYFSCCVYFWHSQKTPSTGSFITTSGFLTWSLVFVIAPLLRAFAPTMHIESEVWNLPKYVVATGMILVVLERQIEHNKFLALHDELTGLPNRRLFHDRLRITLERARRNGTSAALLLIDLDGFKQVNDSLGHHIGDGLLRKVGSVFANRMRRSDTVARTGGDEFSIILEEPVTRLDAERIAHQLSELIEKPIEIEEHSVCIGASIGVALFPEDGVTSEAMCIAADLRMYDVKNGTLRDATDGKGAGSLPQGIAAQVAARLL